uniref:Vomeronasal type-1 receptor n=1 Tax=Xenopus tropicalis TaxID=8364 RepID=A0A6I8RDN9_XENTR
IYKLNTLQPNAAGFVCLLIIGIPANVSLILRFAHIGFIEKKLLPTNIIRMSLSFANLFVLLSRIVPQALYSVGLKNVLNDKQCKLVIFVFRVSRAMVICITSFLSCHQCIIIAPATGKWKYLKQMVNRYVLIIIPLILAMNMAIYPNSILFGRAITNETLSPYTLHLVYCNVDFMNYPTYIINGLVPAMREIIFVGLMALSSIYMVYILFLHGKSMKGMRSSDKGQTVILLVTMYMALFGMDNSMWIYTLTMTNVDPDVGDTRGFLAASFSVLSPIHIFATSPKLHFFFQSQCKKRSIDIQTVSTNENRTIIPKSHNEV